MFTVADTGVDFDCPAFADRVQRGYLILRGNIIMESDGHATHVAGTVLGLGKDTIRSAGNFRRRLSPSATTKL